MTPRAWLLCGLGIALGCCAAHAFDLEQGFSDPPDSARPWAYWTWINGNVSKEGIRADLEDMKRAGIGGVMFFDGSLYLPAGPLEYGTEAWHEHVQYTLAVADELGIKLAPMICPGWATCGGPWNDVEHSMKRLVWSELPLAGGQNWRGALPNPPARLNYYRDVAVLALPDDTIDSRTPAVSSSVERLNTAALVDGNAATDVLLPPATAKPEVTFTFAQATERRLLTIEAVGRPGTESIEGVRGDADFLPGGMIFASDDGKQFRPVATLEAREIEDRLPIEIPFPPASARCFRVALDRSPTRARGAVRVAEIRFSNARRVANLAEKSGLKSETRAFDPQEWSREPAGIALNEVVDLTEKLGPDGVLTWDVPPRHWRVLRFGYTTTGSRNHPAPAAGEGLEVDKFDRGAVEAHLEHALGRILRDAGPLAGRSLAGLMADSWEAGPQNWTAALPEFFRARRGYSLRTRLPALAGRVVGSPAETEAFLADFRRTLGELYAENYFGTVQRMAHQHGLRFFSEAYGGVLDEPRVLGAVDVPMMEFWTHGLYKGFDHAPAMAHFEGKPVIMAEAFTSRPPHAQWSEHPFLLKALGDAAFAAGANALALHCYIHQPRSDIAPGFTLGRYGTHFGRLNSWWPLAPAWIDYLKRCQFLLQQGQPVADLLILQAERLQTEHRELSPPVVPGYQSDLISVSQLERLTARQGILHSPGGATYRVLVTPKEWVAGTATLRHLQRLLESGAIIVGSPPLAPASVPDLEAGYADWQRLVEKLWRASDSARAITTVSPAQALADLSLVPDFRARSTAPAADLRFAHRTAPGLDLYFVSNQTRNPADLSFNEKQFRYNQPQPPGEPVRAELEFRVTGRLPELWDPASGRRVQPAAFTTNATHTRIELSLAAAESLFVVFRQPLPATWPAELSQTGSPLASPDIPLLGPDGACAVFAPGDYQIRLADGRRRSVTVPTLPEPFELPGPWQVAFPPGRGAPASLRLERLAPLNVCCDPGVRYFSGVADYFTSFHLPSNRLTAVHGVYLDLGQVHNLAAVALNGRPVTVLWKPPFIVDVTGLLRPDRNELNLQVANCWVNRLIGDESLPPDASYLATGTAAGALVEFPAWWNDPPAFARRRRIAFATWKHFTAQSPLLPAGLIGPVQLRFGRSVP